MLGLSVASVLIALWQRRRSQQRAVRSDKPVRIPIVMVMH
jgi:hypothetical protein